MREINDYNSLADKVAKYLNRTDAATLDQLQMFINVGESNVYRDVRIPTMEGRALYTIGTITQLDQDGITEVQVVVDSIRVPHNFLTLRSITAPDHNAVIRPKAWTEFTREKDPSNAMPDVYARQGDTLFFNRIPNTPIQIEVLYYRTFNDLNPGNVTGDNDPRPFLQVAYDAFLYGALAEAATYLGDDRLNYFLQRYEGAVTSLNDSAQALELSGGMLEVSINSD